MAQAQAQAQAQAVCQYCGKPVKTGKTCGSLCAKKAQAGFTMQVKLAQKQSLTLPAIPQGWVSLTGKANPICKANYIPVSHLVNATGKDGALYPPMHNICTPCFVNGQRYVHPWLITKAGLQALATYNFTGAPMQNVITWHAPKVK